MAWPGENGVPLAVPRAYPPLAWWAWARGHATCDVRRASAQNRKIAFCSRGREVVKFMPMTCPSRQIPYGGEAEGRTPFRWSGVLRLGSVCQSDRKGVWNG